MKVYEKIIVFFMSLILIVFIFFNYISTTSQQDLSSSTEKPLTVNLQKDLSRFSIEDLQSVKDNNCGGWKTTKLRDTEKDYIEAMFFQDFLCEHSPSTIRLIAAVYKDVEEANERYESPYGLSVCYLNSTSCIIEKNKEQISIEGKEAKLSLIINPLDDRTLNLVEIIFKKESLIVQIVVWDFEKYYEDVAIEIAKEISKKL